MHKNRPKVIARVLSIWDVYHQLIVSSIGALLFLLYFAYSLHAHWVAYQTNLFFAMNALG